MYILPAYSVKKVLTIRNVKAKKPNSMWLRSWPHLTYLLSTESFSFQIQNKRSEMILPLKFKRRRNLVIWRLTSVKNKCKRFLLVLVEWICNEFVRNKVDLLFWYFKVKCCFEVSIKNIQTHFSDQFFLESINDQILILPYEGRFDLWIWLKRRSI